MNARAPSLTDQVYQAIEEETVTLALAPGQVLSENALADSLGIGRTPVREALQRLACEGLVLILPRRGVMVTDVDVRKQLELLRVRRVGRPDRLHRIVYPQFGRRHAVMITVFEQIARTLSGKRKSKEDRKGASTLYALFNLSLTFMAKSSASVFS